MEKRNLEGLLLKFKPMFYEVKTRTKTRIYGCSELGQSYNILVDSNSNPRLK